MNAIRYCALALLAFIPVRGEEQTVDFTVSMEFPAALPSFADPVIEDFLGPVEKRALHVLDPSPAQAIMAALLAGDMGRLAELIALGEDPNGFSPLGDTPLCYAIRTGNRLATQWLLESGASLEMSGLEGQPPAWVAWACQDSAILETLLMHGADPDTMCWSPADEVFLSFVKDSLFRKALVNDRGLTLLMAASALNNQEMIRLLKKHGAKVNRYTEVYKRYPINYAAMNGHTEAMQILLGHEPEPETEVVVSLEKQKATYYKKGEAILSSSVSTGKKGFRTPPGTFVVTNKHKAWTSTIYDASMPYFMRLSCGAIGLHAGNVPGYAASHGCIRLPYSKAKEFFATVPIGTKVRIIP